MAEIKISLKMDEKLRQDLAEIVSETVRNAPSSLGNAVRSGVVEHKAPLRELVYDINTAREKALLALLPEELRPKKEETSEVNQDEQ